MASTEEDALSEVYYLTNDTTKNWRKLLKYGETLNINLKRKLLWLWPTEKCLWQINTILRDCNISCLLSIGCGSGLLEWLLRESLNVQIFGLEVDQQWWCSRYAIKSFIDLKYTEDVTALNENFLQNCCLKNDWNFALLFCYFNNSAAFLQYLQLYKGNHIIIIGPLTKRDIFTDPLPLNVNFPYDQEVEWILKTSLNIGEDDVMAVYEKCLRTFTATKCQI